MAQKNTLQEYLLFKCLLVLSLFLGGLAFSPMGKYEPPKITVRRLSSTNPVISHFQNNSDFLYNYNAAYLKVPAIPSELFVAVRVQNLRPNAKTIYDVGPSSIAIGSIHYDLTPEYISKKNVFISPEMAPQYQDLGAEDPRIVFHNNKYYLFYTAVKNDSSPGSKPSDLGQVKAFLALATCDIGEMQSRLSVSKTLKKSEWVTLLSECWELRGPIFPHLNWSKSGALLVRPSEDEHYLFWGDLDISIAVTKDMINYTDTGQYLLKRRSDSFDSHLIESGPEPLMMDDGNYLFIYNSARKVNVSSPKPGWDLQYNFGYAILEGKNPRHVIYRSDEPLYSPELEWEKCLEGDWGRKGLTPNVVFVEGWKKTDKNRFLLIYQGCDSVLSLMELETHWT